MCYGPTSALRCVGGSVLLSLSLLSLLSAPLPLVARLRRPFRTPSMASSSSSLPVLALLLAVLLAQLCVVVSADADVAHVEPRAVAGVEQVRSWPDGAEVTVLFTASPGGAPVILHNIPIFTGSVSPWSSSSGPKIPGGAIAGLIVGIVLLWTLLLLLCLIIILAATLASGGTRFSEGTGTCGLSLSLSLSGSLARSRSCAITTRVCIAQRPTEPVRPVARVLSRGMSHTSASRALTHSLTLAHHRCCAATRTPQSPRATMSSTLLMAARARLDSPTRTRPPSSSPTPRKLLELAIVHERRPRSSLGLQASNQPHAYHALPTARYQHHSPQPPHTATRRHTSCTRSGCEQAQFCILSIRDA